MFSNRRISWFRRIGIRTRLVLFFLTFFGFTLGAFSIAGFRYLSHVHKKEFDAALYNYVVDAWHILDKQPLPAQRERWHLPSEMILPFSLGETLLQVSDLDGAVLLGSPNLDTHRLPSRLQGRNNPVRVQFEDLPILAPKSDRPARHRMVTYRVERGGRDYLVQAAVPMILLDRQEQGVMLFLILWVPLVLILASGGGFVLSRQAMGPISEVIQRATQIGADHLSDRLAVPETRDEIRELVLTLNGLLDRLENLFVNQEAFIADVSHQLKTPLAVLKGEVELFRQKHLPTSELGEWLANVQQEVNYLSRIVEDLLLLARAGAETGTESRRKFRLDEKVMECVSRLTPLAAKRDIHFSFNLEAAAEEGDYAMSGEPELIRSMVQSLAENAVKYSPPGAEVSLRLRDDGDTLTLRVDDQGPGIPSGDLPRIFERFYRAPGPDRAPGAGLGLSIVQKVVALHGGRVHAETLPEGGARFEVNLPRYS